MNGELINKLNIDKNISYDNFINELNRYEFPFRYYLLLQDDKYIYTNYCPKLFNQRLELSNNLTCMNFPIDLDNYLNFDINGKIFIMCKLVEYKNQLNYGLINNIITYQIINILYNMPYIYKNDKDIIERAIHCNGDYLQYASNEIKNDYIFVLYLIQIGGSVCYVSNELKDNDEFIIEVSKIHYPNFEYASNRLKNDENFIINLIKIIKNIHILNFISDRLKDNEEFILDILKMITNYNIKKEVLNYVSNRLENLIIL